MYCDGSFTNMWSFNVFIYDFRLPSPRVKKFCQVIRVRPAHSLKVLQLSPDVNFRLSIQARKQGGAGGKCVGHSLQLLDMVRKIWAPLKKLFAPPGVLRWLRACVYPTLNLKSFSCHRKRQ